MLRISRRTKSTFAVGAVSFVAIFLCTPHNAAAAQRSPGPMLAEALEGPLADVEEVVFAVRSVGGDGHWYANFGHRSNNEKQMNYGPGGAKLCGLNLRSGKLRVLLDDPGGGIRDPQVHYDGRKILFCYRRADSIYYHLYEINVDGSGLKQLTDGPADDLEPIYLPDGDILFCSSRCNRFVQCWHTSVAVRYRCDKNGENVRLLSANVEHDNTPWLLWDGRVLYMRWEYIDRSRVRYHHLWTSNPDGTAETVFYGNQQEGTVMLDAKPIPHTDKVVSIFSPGHGRKEHAGALTVVDPTAGPDDRSRARRIGNSSDYRDPYPLAEDCFLVAEGANLLLIDGEGRTEVLYTNDDRPQTYWVHEPRPLRRRAREPVIPSRLDRSKETGFLLLANVTHGRNMAGVRRGEIKELLVLEALPKPINHSGTMEPISLDGTFTLPRILGTVPVEEDGSAYMEVPALRSLFFVALDEDDMAVKRMQSFVNVMPGETTSCAGCHERRTDTVRPISRATLTAASRRPSRIRPIAGVPEVFDFPRDIQPILDKHCVQCHGYEKPPAGGFPLAGARGPWYSHSYHALMSRGQVSHGRDSRGNYPPRGIGSSASKLMTLIDGSHYDAKLSAVEQAKIRLWIESGAPYAGTYAALGTGMIGIRPPADLLQQRCGECHNVGKLGRYPTDVQYNLTDAARSPILLAPLSRAVGGWGLCRKEPFDAKPKPADVKRAPPANVFASTDDPDYQKLLIEIQKAKAALDKIKRFDMPDFVPNQHYIREMKRYGVLAADLDPQSERIDPYKTDADYWRSLWHRPEK